MMENVFYIYRFLDKKDNLLYIGRTNDINRRILKEHFTSLGHLPLECYSSIENVQYAQFENESEEVSYEAILINKLKPRYNVQFKDDGNFNIELPEFKWIDFVFPYDSYLKYLKNRKNKTQDIKDFIINNLESINLDDDSIKTGFMKIDRVTSIRDTDLILIAGDTSIGKTTYALNICNFVATRLNKKVLYVNLKEDAESLTEKLIAKISRIPLDKIRKKLFNEEEWQLYTSTIEAIFLSDIRFSNLKYEDKTIDNIITTIKSDSYDLIIIDDLHSVINDKDIYIKDKTLEIMQKLKSLTLDIKTPVILISGISTSKILSRMDHRPNNSDFEYDSMRTFPDIIKFLYRDENYYDDTQKRNIIEVIVDKNSLGFSGVVELLFIESHCSIYNIVEEENE